MNPLAWILRAQQSRTFRWLLGLSNFNLMGEPPGQDPIRRMQVRVVTTLIGLLALATTLLALLVAGVAALAASTLRPAGWVLLVGSLAALLLVGQSLWRSRRGRMPDPGVLYVTALLNLSGVAAAVAILANVPVNG